MYKTKLQELCQGRGWDLPEYATVKIGPDHAPRFTATVSVKGAVYETPHHCKSSKEAQNTVAQVAFDHLNVPPPPRPNPPTSRAAATLIGPNLPPPLPSSLPIPSPGLVAAKSDANVKSASRETLLQKYEDSVQQASVCIIKSVGSHDKGYKETLHMYKNQLQQYVQRYNLGFPVYTCEADGPPHNRRFKSKVSLDGKSYETSESFTTLKEAEQAAAKVACQTLRIDVIQEDGGLYKNLLQERAQKMGLLCPTYETTDYGMSHKRSFTSSVEIDGKTFKGDEAKSKRQAEMNAAKAAYLALTECYRAKESPCLSSISSLAVGDNSTKGIQPTDIVMKQHRDAGDEVPSKKAKSDTQLRIENFHSPRPSHGGLPHDDSCLLPPQPEHLDAAVVDPFNVEPVAEGQTQPQMKTVVFPRKLNLPVPNNASVMPYSDEHWVACQVDLKSESNA